MLDFTELFGSGGALLVPVQQTQIFGSRNWTAPQDGVVIIRALAAGGSGASHSSGSNNHVTKGTGGYSGGWGVKVLRITKGEVINVVIGGGGVAVEGVSDGKAGGNTTVKHRGVTYTTYGGLGGTLKTSLPLPAGALPSDNWDLRIASVAPGGECGAGVDILGTGSVKSSDSVVGRPGFFFGTPGLTDGQGVGGSNEWGISFHAGTSAKGNGVGGGGGGGAVDGGIGAGGNSTPKILSGRGGNGYAHIKFFLDMK